MFMRGAIGLGFALIAIAAAAQSDDSAKDQGSADLAKKLQNPVANLISVPVKYDWDTGIGAAKSDRSTLVVQPVIPFSLNDDWIVVSRTILPFIGAQSPVPGGDSQRGIGDVTQSFFVGPKKPTADGWIWAAGPVALLPTASKSTLGGGKVGLGPTAVALKQQDRWTYGVLVNHIWSVAGPNDRNRISVSYVQPFLSYTFKSYTTVGLSTESTYDWKNSQWTVPINVSVSQLLKIGGQPLSFALGLRSYVSGPSGGPDWGVRFTTTLLFPK